MSQIYASWPSLLHAIRQQTEWLYFRVKLYTNKVAFEYNIDNDLYCQTL